MGLLLAFILGAAMASALVLLTTRRESRTPDLGVNLLKEAVHRLEVSQEGANRATAENLATLLSGHSDVLRHTSNLSHALTNPGLRGQWGEVSLRNVCEAAGMSEHIDFDVQAYVRSNQEGESAARPDLVIRLPGGGHVCVDAKVPLEAFREAISQDDPAARRAALDLHVKQVRAKVRVLAAKAYWARFTRTPEMVVMFIPSEAAFAAAAQHDPSLIEGAAKERVVIATPSTMLALLQVVSLGWREQALTDNAEQIRTRAVELIKRLGTVSGHLSAAGRALESASRAHNQAVRSYESRLLVTARQLGELGVAGGGELESPTLVETVVHPASDISTSAVE